MRLFCFHHAGGSASVFHSWARRLPDIEIVSVQLPGRANRLSEECVTDFSRLVSLAVEAIDPELGKPYALFGHSMGGLLAFELARCFEARGKPPVSLFVSGVRAAPKFHEGRTRQYSDLTDRELVEDIAQLGGTPRAMLENEELLELILPVIRADYAAIDSYRFEGGPHLRCPIVAMAGISDTETSREYVEAWQSLTQSRFTTRWYPGDHFFIQSSEEHVTRDIFHHLS